MLSIAQEMLENNNLCVLATCSHDLPNSSLMHYVYDPVGMNILMLTLRGSVKHVNITENPHVSLLIDTRTDATNPGMPVMALTVYGKAGFVDDPNRQQIWIDQLVARNGSLSRLASDSQCLVIQVHMEKMLLLDGVSDKSTFDIWDACPFYTVRLWVRSADYWTVHFDIIEQVRQRFDQEGRKVPYPLDLR